jgi:hypothetical protein
MNSDLGVIKLHVCLETVNGRLGGELRVWNADARQQCDDFAVYLMNPLTQHCANGIRHWYPLLDHIFRSIFGTRRGEVLLINSHVHVIAFQIIEIPTTELYALPVQYFINIYTQLIGNIQAAYHASNE